MPSDFAPLSRDPVAITVAGTRILLPYRPAAVWATGLDRLGHLAGHLADPEDRERIAELLLEHPRVADDLKRESLRILGEEAGRKWWEAARLISTSVSTEVLGRLVLAGADAWTRSIGEWVAAVYALCMKGRDEKERLRFEFSLSIPPPGYEDEWDDDGVDPEAAMAAIAQMTGKK